MKALKFFAAIAAATLLAASCGALFRAASADGQASTASLTKTNGLQAGLSLLNLYTQFKSAGKMDLSNTSNLTNLLTLASNINGLSQTTNTNPFVSGLISGSNNLVTNSNSGAVLNTLSSLSNMNLSSLATTAAATSAVNNLANKATAATTSAAQKTTSAATSALTALFSALK